MPLKDWLLALSVVTLWGLNFIAVKVTVQTIPPFLLTALRFALVAGVLAPLFHPQHHQWKGIIGIAAVLGVGHFGLMFVGVSGMDAASAAIITQLGVPFSALLAWIAFGEPLGLGRGIGLVLAFAGVALLAGEPGVSSLAPVLILVAAMIAWAVSNVQVKRLGAVNPLALNGWMAVFAAPMLLALSLATETGHADIPARMMADWKPWAGLLYTVIGSSLIAYSLWYGLLGRHAMNRLVPVTLLGPVVAVAGGVLVLGETLTWQKLVGGAITIIGVAVIQFLGGNPQPPAEPEPGS
ncbi:DMT family transporter [Magnetospirillum sulfuroxidans]|uniref:EamA family transporter n=1 Tax=Magnetospirillum sulfuroxidans TaxID=611300 RepID=A0ABS5IBE6_9PROT|nr:EamA family transporter [Magnetospirillum sulfuroxidans]MBR9971747.1 EamA family transporter [Magnetospirillum sulfuroxidans]